MTEETMIPLATPTRFLMENGEWNLTPSLLNEINPFDYNTAYRPIMKEQQQQDYQPPSDPESDSTSSPTMSLSTSPSSSSVSFRQSPPTTFHSNIYQPVIQPNQTTINSNNKKMTSVSSGRKRRIIFEGEDAEERRKKFLERNRVAAYKCRQKKKTWMQELENKAETQNKQNEELRAMVSQLKEESMYLRNLLLTHGNCECESVQAYLRKTSLEISNNTSLSRRNSSFSSTGLTPYLNTVINKPSPTQDYFSSFHHNQV